MTQPAKGRVGSVVTLWRYPVKSMLGEELNASEVSESGLLGDRAYALVDTADGKIASAKNPRKWSRMSQFHAALAGEPDPGESLPAVRITLPDGDLVSSEQADHDERLSRALDRAVTLQVAGRGDRRSGAASSQDIRPDTFFDCAAVHVLTTATLDQLREFYPQGRFEVRRFRPNLVVDTTESGSGFAKDAWIGHTIRIGDQVRLYITGPCPRCVMTTLAQADLSKDSGILRTAAQHHGVNVGAHGGKIGRGDRIWLE